MLHQRNREVENIRSQVGHSPPFISNGNLSISEIKLDSMSPRSNINPALMNHSALIMPNKSMMSAGFALKQERSRETHNYTQGI